MLPLLFVRLLPTGRSGSPDARGASSEKGKQEVSSDQTNRDASARGVQDPERDRESPLRPLQSSYESTTDALKLFLREVGRHPLLTAAQEVELGRASCRERV